MGRVKFLLKNIGFSIIVTIFFIVFSSLPSIGYYGKIRDVHIIGEDASGNLHVLADGEMLFNPVLYPLSWLTGDGKFSRKFSFISAPLYGAPPTGEYFPHRYMPSRYDLMQEALDSLIVPDLVVNAIFLFIVIVISSFFKVYDFYLSLFVGGLFFTFGGAVGAFTSFLILELILMVVKVKLKKPDLLLQIWNILKS